ncbi:MAG: Uncharacterised protein [Porticoccaceae bacterium UBA1117]|nr:MAG: Uncharacterised protein [Porticoccaceae bacterium UBA1117]
MLFSCLAKKDSMAPAPGGWSPAVLQRSLWLLPLQFFGCVRSVAVAVALELTALKLTATLAAFPLSSLPSLISCSFLVALAGLSAGFSPCSMGSATAATSSMAVRSRSSCQIAPRVFFTSAAKSVQRGDYRRPPPFTFSCTRGPPAPLPPRGRKGGRWKEEGRFLMRNLETRLST